MQRGTVTIDDVARHLGVAKGTVSRALNGYPDIAPATRTRIQAAATELGYRPSSNARRLKRGRTDTIGFVMLGQHAGLAEPFLASFLDGAARRLEEASLDLLVVTTARCGDPVEPYRRLIQTRKVDGFLLARTARQDPRIRHLRETGVPFVSHGRSLSAQAHAWLDMDNHWAMREAVRHVAARGHRRIAHIGGPSDLNFAHDRLQGYRAGLADHGLEADPMLIVEGGLDAASGAAAMATLLALAEPPTAVVTVTDTVAIGVLQSLRQRGLIGGRDISVVSYDNVPVAAFTDPPLTTFAQDASAAGNTAATMLLSLLAGTPVTSLQTLWRPRLVERRSVSPAHLSPSELRRRLDDVTVASTTREDPCTRSDAT